MVAVTLSRAARFNAMQGVSVMGQNNSPTERGDRQGQQGRQVKPSDAEIIRQSGYAAGAGADAPVLSKEDHNARRNGPKLPKE